MAITLNTATTNNQDWVTQFEFQASYDNGETFGLIDFTGATIEISLQSDERCRPLIEARTDNDKITINATGFELNIPKSEMETLCPGNYNIGGVYELDGETISLFTGSLTVIDGVAKI